MFPGAALQPFAGVPAPTEIAHFLNCGSGRAREGPQSGPKLLD
ncbi:hypothetical protein ABIB24_003851 [Pseudomonas sp. UYEF17]